MSDFITTRAAVLREVHYKEADRILTLYSQDLGQITAKASGALRKNSRLAAPTQQLTYSEFTLFCHKDRYNVQEAVTLEPFDGLRMDFSHLSLACYFAECVEAMTEEAVPEPTILQLFLNSLYALSHNLRSEETVKAAFELRLMCLLGYQPNLTACEVCGAEDPKEPMLDVSSGVIRCRSCRVTAAGLTVPLFKDTLTAMRRITSAPARQLFSFSIGEDATRNLSKSCETFLIEHAERHFATLEYWKTIKIYGGNEK